MPYDEEVANTNAAIFGPSVMNVTKPSEIRYEARIESNRMKAHSWPEYKSNAKEREKLAEKMRDVILAHAKEATE